MEFTERELKAFERLIDPERIAKYDDANPGGLGIVLERNAEQYPESTALYFEDSTLTYDELNCDANRVANHFLELGMQKGQVCALLLDNSPDYLKAFLGLTKTGIVGSLINPNLKKKSLAHVLKVARADCILVHARLAVGIREIEDDIEFPEESVWVWGDSGDQIAPFNDFQAAFLRASPRNPPISLRPRMADIITHIFTSGTTGLPKAVNIRAKNWLQSGELVFKVAANCNSSDNIYSPLPLHHAMGMISVAGALTLGSGFAFRRRFSAGKFWLDIRKSQATTATYIGEIPRYLFNQPESPDDADNPLKTFIGLGLKGEIWERFRQRFDIQDIIELYGASEVRGTLVNMAGKVGMVGRILDPNTAALLRYDTDSDSFFRDNNKGLIRCSTPGEQGIYIINTRNIATSLNEYTDDSQTETKLLRDVFEKGDVWFNSGDLLMLHEDGWLSFSDRLGDTFRWKSENVSTQEVESILMDFPAIELAVVYGVQIENMSGQAGMVSLVQKQNVDWDWLAFTGFVREHLPSYAVPRFVRFRRQLEMTATMKIKKVKLRKEGFDPDRISDPLFFWNGETHEYSAISKDSFNLLSSGKIRI